MLLDLPGPGFQHNKIGLVHFHISIFVEIIRERRRQGVEGIPRAGGGPSSPLE